MRLDIDSFMREGGRVCFLQFVGFAGFFIFPSKNLGLCWQMLVHNYSVLVFSYRNWTRVFHIVLYMVACETRKSVGV
jgi:hypothetical protein